MKAFLMHPDRDFDTERELPANEEALTAGSRAQHVAERDGRRRSAAVRGCPAGPAPSLTEPDAIAYRQQVLADCLSKPAVARDLYATAGEALSAQRSVWGGILEQDAPRLLLRTSVRKMEILVGFLRRLREIADTHVADVRSPGLSRFFAMLVEELSDDYFDLIERYLKELNLKGGVLLSARLTTGNKGSEYTLRRAREQGFIARMLDRSGYSFTLADRDDAGARRLAELEDKGLNLVADALARSVDHVLGFLRMLRTEVGFYVACLNLADELTAKARPRPSRTSSPSAGHPPRPWPVRRVSRAHDETAGGGKRCGRRRQVVGDDHRRQPRRQVDVPAQRRAGPADGAVRACSWPPSPIARTPATACSPITGARRTRRWRAASSTRSSRRMSEIADRIHAGCLLLCNESFAATNEREGSQIARQVIDALLAEDIKVLFVTHLFDLAEATTSGGCRPRCFCGPVAARRREIVPARRRRAATHQLRGRLLSQGLRRPARGESESVVRTGRSPARASARAVLQ